MIQLHRGLLHIIHNDFGPFRASKFIHQVQVLTNNWLLHTGFSVGVQDFILKPAMKLEIEERMRNLEEEHYRNVTGGVFPSEDSIIGHASRVTNRCLWQVVRLLPCDNGLLSIWNSGSSSFLGGQVLLKGTLLATCSFFSFQTESFLFVSCQVLLIEKIL